jgi:XTP/dITP diphosphohydrolase
MRSLLLGTRNPGKVIEITNILADSGWFISSLQEFPEVGEAEENFVTFAENAIAKACFYASATGLCALADDSGLEVAALNGAPGVFSARYASVHASDADRRALLLSELAKTGDTNRRARFVAVVAIATPSGEILNLSEGICEGTITFSPRGMGGFGYDPLFVPHGYDQTFAELPDTIKNLISHRARALQGTREFLSSGILGRC